MIASDFLPKTGVFEVNCRKIRFYCLHLSHVWSRVETKEGGGVYCYTAECTTYQLNTKMKHLFRKMLFCLLGMSTAVMASAQLLPTPAPTEHAWQLLNVCSQKNSDGNVCVSPLSLEVAMAMLLNGADDDTELQIAKTFGWAHYDRSEVNKMQQKRIKTLTSGHGITVELANSVWVNRNLKRVKRAFTRNNAKYYNAEVGRVYMNEETRVGINKWCAVHTHDKIPTILSQLDPETKLLLINALYFKGSWMSHFEKDLTENRPFYPSPEADAVEVPMMMRKGFYNYAQTSDCQIVELPFKCAGGPQYSMYFILPAKGVSANDLLRGMDDDRWNQLTAALKSREVRLSMPRFKMEYSSTLNEALKQMGIRDAFIPGKAEFSRITNSSLAVSSVLQKTFLEVNEYGAEGAAVTAIAVMTTALPRPNMVEVMTLDRPYLYLIMEKTTQSVLFMGKMENPKK